MGSRGDVGAKDGEAPSARQLSRDERRTAGERSAGTARRLMQAGDADVARLGLDEDLLAEVRQARAVTSNVARRRAERRLAGVLRDADLDDVEARLSRLQESDRAEAAQFKLAESWRARLIEGTASGDELCASATVSDPAALAKAIGDARRERTTGKPRGAARALFRLIVAALRRGGL